MSQPISFVVAGIQCDPQIARPDLNLEMIADLAARARAAGAALAIFPECAVSGYCFDSAAEALEVAEPVHGPATTALAAIASSPRPQVATAARNGFLAVNPSTQQEARHP